MALHSPIDITNLTYSIVERILFNSFSARIHAGDKIALIGHNGSGKSTLLKLIKGMLDPTKGSIYIPENVRLGYVPQNLEFKENCSVWDILIEPVKEVFADLKRLEELTNQEISTPETLAEYNMILERLTATDSFSLTYSLESLLDNFELIQYKHTLVSNLSGGERMRLAFACALVHHPNVLLADEPTNHLDIYNREKLLKFLSNWLGTLLVVSHDIALLNSCISTFWHIQEQQITIFNGSYNEYQLFLTQEAEKRAAHIEKLEKEKNKLQNALQDEQKRAAQSRRANAHENDRALKGSLKMRGDSTTGRNNKNLNKQKQKITEELSHTKDPEVITPKFALSRVNNSSKNSIEISNGQIKYNTQATWLLDNINLTLGPNDRAAIQGANGSGKSTFVKALINLPDIEKTGSWHIPSANTISYLDQQYSILNSFSNAFEAIKTVQKNWTDLEVRKHLNNFLFRKNEEVFAPINSLSGGERARLSLAIIGAQSPQLLILDEITNNLDHITRSHVIKVLQAYSGALIVISHDNDFLKQIAITRFLKIYNNSLIEERDIV